MAPTSLHPGGTVGSVKWTSERSLAAVLDSTFSVASPPKLENPALCETQLSKSARTTRCDTPLHA